MGQRHVQFVKMKEEDALEMWIWRMMEKIACTYQKRNVEALDMPHAGRKTSNSYNDNCKQEMELDWSRVKRRGFVERKD